MWGRGTVVCCWAGVSTCPGQKWVSSHLLKKTKPPQSPWTLKMPWEVSCVSGCQGRAVQGSCGRWGWSCPVAAHGAAAGVGMSFCCSLASLVAPGLTTRWPSSVLTCPLQGWPKRRLSKSSHCEGSSSLFSCPFVFQPSKEEANEEKTEDNLTTLFPGQKRRISHLVKQGNVSADLEADV